MIVYQHIESNMYDVKRGENGELNWSLRGGIDSGEMEKMHVQRTPQPIDYRKVQYPHIRKLLKLVEVDFTTSTVANSLVLYGTFYLPAGFVLTVDFNKTVDPTTFDMEQGKKLLREKNISTCEEKLWEFEGYRLYRILTTLNSLGVSEVALNAIANGKPTYELVGQPMVGVLYEEGEGENAKEYMFVMRDSLYARIRALMDTYIEYSREHY